MGLCLKALSFDCDATHLLAGVRGLGAGPAPVCVRARLAGVSRLAGRWAPGRVGRARQVPVLKLETVGDDMYVSILRR
ncbi:MAG: hypothetical protein ACO2PN_28030 [Pyrobaculum sp.]